MRGIGAHLNKTCTLRAPSSTADDYGTSTVTYTDTTGVATAYRPMTSEEAVRWGREATIGLYRFYFEFSVTIAAGYLIVCDSRTFRVLDAEDPGGRGHHYEVPAEEEIQ